MLEGRLTEGDSLSKFRPQKVFVAMILPRGRLLTYSVVRLVV